MGDQREHGALRQWDQQRDRRNVPGRHQFELLVVLSGAVDQRRCQRAHWSRRMSAIQQVFNWFNANGGANRPFAEPPTCKVSTRASAIRSIRRIRSSTPRALVVCSVSAAAFASDWVFRDFNDFYITRTDLSTGKATDDLGKVYDLNLIENSNDLERRYQGGTFQANYRFGGGVEVGGNYTLSRTWGNFDGENPASGPLTAQLFSYPEYREARWNQAEGNLGADQRHRARIYGTYHVPMSSTAGSLDFGVVYGAASGTPYTFGGAAATSPGTGIGQINSSPYVTNPGYATPVTRVEYYFFPSGRVPNRGAVPHRSVDQLPISTGRWSRHLLPRRSVNIFNQYQLCGCGGTVFNNGGGSDIRTINNAVLTSVNSAALQAFNPFTTTPVQGVNWNLSPTFGTPANRFAYTSPRTFRFNFGRQDSDRPAPGSRLWAPGLRDRESPKPRAYSYRSAAIGSSAAAFRAG